MNVSLSFMLVIKNSRILHNHKGQHLESCVQKYLNCKKYKEKVQILFFQYYECYFYSS